jgi:hypothetical protein
LVQWVRVREAWCEDGIATWCGCHNEVDSGGVAVKIYVAVAVAVSDAAIDSVAVC